MRGYVAKMDNGNLTSWLRRADRCPGLVYSCLVPHTHRLADARYLLSVTLFDQLQSLKCNGHLARAWPIVV
jgi:hypothetical protein